MNVLWSADEERDGVPAGRLGEDQRKNRRLTELQMEELLLAAPLINRGPAGRRRGRVSLTSDDINSSQQRGRLPMQDLFSLKGRIALVTGGSRGIGEMIAEGYVKAGAKVYISARKAAACEETAKRLSVFGECIAMPADASGAAGARTLADLYLAKESKLNILVNNAGAAWGSEIEAFPEGGWDKVMDLNVKAPFFLVQALLGALRAGASAARPAKVINIASIDGLSVNMQPTYSYSASKAGLIHLTKRLALELAPQHIVVSAIAPGAFASNMNKLARDKGDTLAKQIPSRRIGTPEDMAGAAIFLASRAGDYVVGDALAVDGGVAWTRHELE